RAYFADHPLGNTILGTPKSIQDLRREQMVAYLERRYVASNITVVAAGNFDWQAFVAEIAKHCAAWAAGPTGRQDVRETSGSKAFQVLTKPSVAQEHVFLLSPGPSADSPLRYAADTLALAIGDDSGSRLYWLLVDPGLADSAACRFHEY